MKTTITETPDSITISVDRGPKPAPEDCHRVHYHSPSDIGKMVALQTGMPTVAFRRADVRDPGLPIPHMRVDPESVHPNLVHPNWIHFPVTIMNTDTVEEAIEVVKVWAKEIGAFAVVYDGEGNFIGSNRDYR